MKTWITAVIVLAAVFLGGWLLGRRASRPEVVETVRIDTVFYERPQPVSVSDNVVTVDLPRLLFVAREPSAASITNQDTIQVTNQGRDSVQMQIIMRTLEYRDSTYYARVVGPVVGDITPRLDYIETYDKTITRTVTYRPIFMLSAGAGTEYSASGWAPFAEIDFSVDLKFATVSATVGADDVLSSPLPRFGVKAAFPLWSR